MTDVLDGRYRLEEVLLRTELGTCWRAHDGDGSVTVAVLDGTEAVDLQTRFTTQHEQLVGLPHRHLLGVRAVGEDGAPFAVLDPLAGESLASRLVRAPAMTLPELFTCVEQTLQGVGKAHEADLVHGRLRPDVIFLEADGARVFGFGMDRPIPKSSGPIGEGALRGLAFLAPEQVGGDGDIGPRTDLYAAGVLLRAALTGEPPFVADTLEALREAIRSADVTPLAEVVPELRGVVGKTVGRMMAAEPTRRYGNANAAYNSVMAARVMSSRLSEHAVPRADWMGVAVAPIPSSEDSADDPVMTVEEEQAAPAVVASPAPTAVAGEAASPPEAAEAPGDDASEASATAEGTAPSSAPTDEPEEPVADARPAPSRDPLPERPRRSSERAPAPAAAAAAPAAKSSGKLRVVFMAAAVLVMVGVGVAVVAGGESEGSEPTPALPTPAAPSGDETEPGEPEETTPTDTPEHAADAEDAADSDEAIEADEADAEEASADDDSADDDGAGASVEPVVDPNVRRVRVRVRGVLRGTELKVDGVVREERIFEMPADGRSHTFEVSGEGYAPWTRELTPTRDVVLRARLERIREDD